MRRGFSRSLRPGGTVRHVSPCSRAWHYSLSCWEYILPEVATDMNTEWWWKSFISHDICSYGAIFDTWMTSDDKDHLVWNDRKDSHYNLMQSNGSADLDLMPIEYWIASCVPRKTLCLKHPVVKHLLNLSLYRRGPFPNIREFKHSNTIFLPKNSPYRMYACRVYPGASQYIANWLSGQTPDKRVARVS